VGRRWRYDHTAEHHPSTLARITPIDPPLEPEPGGPTAEPVAARLTFTD
jgi:hypothetical protein